MFLFHKTKLEGCPNTYLEVKAAAGKVSLCVTVLLALRRVEHVGEVTVEVRQEAALIVGVVTVGRVWAAREE